MSQVHLSVLRVWILIVWCVCPLSASGMGRHWMHLSLLIATLALEGINSGRTMITCGSVCVCVCVCARCVWRGEEVCLIKREIFQESKQQNGKQTYESVWWPTFPLPLLLLACPICYCCFNPLVTQQYTHTHTHTNKHAHINISEALTPCW